MHEHNRQHRDLLRNDDMITDVAAAEDDNAGFIDHRRRLREMRPAPLRPLDPFKPNRRRGVRPALYLFYTQNFLIILRLTLAHSRAFVGEHPISPPTSCYA